MLKVVNFLAMFCVGGAIAQTYMGRLNLAVYYLCFTAVCLSFRITFEERGQ